MPTIPELLSANLHEVFGNRDAESRRAAIERIFTEDVVFADPEGEARGWDGLEQKAASILDGTPASFTLTDAGPAYLGPDSGALAWTFGPEGEPVARGIDLIEVRDGRIHTLRTLLA